MIYRRAGERVLMDVEALWAHTGRRPVATIRAKCTPVACDIETRRLLYDADKAAERLRDVARRAAHKRPRRAQT